MPAIDYAPPLPWYRRRRIHRAAIWLITLALLITAGSLFGPTAYRRTLLLYWQHRCMNYQFPPDTLVWQTDIDPEKAGPQPADLDALRQYVDLDVRDALDDPYPVLFMHSRTCAAGQRFVILQTGMIGLADTADKMFAIACLKVTIISPGSISKNTAVAAASRYYRRTIGGAIPHPDPEKFFGGYPDPDDPAAIIIPYEINGKRYTTRFALTPAGDAIEPITP